MDFSFTAEEERFRQEVRSFLRENPPEAFPLEMEDDGYGFGGSSREFGRAIGAKGWISQFWPRRYGGAERPFIEFLIRNEEFAYGGAPLLSILMAESIARAIIEYGNEFLQKEMLPLIARGEIVFWLAFSEPDAGSDLLALQTRARREGDYYIIDGQKTWSARAHIADYGYLLARTDLVAPAQRGLSAFILDKNTPGVTIRPIMNLEGVRYHNELFLDHVRVHKRYLIGEENKGIQQLLHGLECDRFEGRFFKAPFCRRLLGQLVEHAKETKDSGGVLADNAVTRHRLAESAIEIETCRLLLWRAGSMMQKGASMTYEGTVAKVLADEMGKRLFNLGLQTMRLYPRPAESPKWDTLRKRLVHYYLVSVGHTLAGGTSEIIRNTIALRGLQMPRQ